MLFQSKQIRKIAREKVRGGGVEVRDKGERFLTRMTYHYAVSAHFVFPK